MTIEQRRRWFHITPALENDSTRWAWNLEMHFDPDNDEVSLSADPGNLTLRVQLTDDVLAAIKQAIVEDTE